MNIPPLKCSMRSKNSCLILKLLFSNLISNSFEAFTLIKSFQKVHDADFLFPFHQRLEDL
jgi:hypothetical protein